MAKKNDVSKKRGVSKARLAVLGVVIVILLLIFATFVVPLISESPAAVLIVDGGSVQVAQSPYRDTTGETNLKEGDSIKTGTDGRASVVLFGGTVVRLDSNTEINLKTLAKEKGNRKVSINQTSGRIWSRVIKLSGIDS